MGGLFEAVDPGVVAAGESVGEGFFEADLLFAGGGLLRNTRTTDLGGTLPWRVPLWFGAHRRACALRGTRVRRRGEAAVPSVHHEEEEGVGAGGEVVGGGGVLEGG